MYVKPASDRGKLAISAVDSFEFPTLVFNFIDLGKRETV